MSAPSETPQLQPDEPLSELAAFRVSESDKRALTLLKSVDPEHTSESEVIRRFFDFDALRAAANEIRAKLAAVA